MSYFMWTVVCALLCYLIPALLLYVSYIINLTFQLLNRFGILGNNYSQMSNNVITRINRIYNQFWNGYEIQGLDKIPNRPCIFVGYHGAFPLDIAYIVSRFHEDNRPLYTVAAVHIFSIFGLGSFLREYFHFLGKETNVEKCKQLLEAGNHVLIMPGGIYEAQTTHHTTYQLMWKERVGFAKIALESGAPIIPLFTTNINESYRGPRWVYALWRRFLPNTPVPYLPPVGGLPVKLVTHLGDPIETDPKLTPQQLRKKVEDALNELIGQHQRIPGDMFQALLDRFRSSPKEIKTI